MPIWTPHPTYGSPTWDDYQIQFVARAQLNGTFYFSWPADALAYHYLSGSGAPLNIDFGLVINEEPVPLRNELFMDILDALNFADKHSENGVISSTTWTATPTLGRWKNAIGHVPWSGEGQVSEGYGGCMSMSLQYYMHDAYDFEKTMDRVGILHDFEYRRLHTVGLADEFLMTGKSGIIEAMWKKGNPPKIIPHDLDFQKGGIIFGESYGY
jgi:hypothetical protein